MANALRKMSRGLDYQPIITRKMMKKYGRALLDTKTHKKRQTFWQWIKQYCKGIRSAYNATLAQGYTGRDRAEFLYKRGYFKVPTWVQKQGGPHALNWVMASRNKAFWA